MGENPGKPPLDNVGSGTCVFKKKKSMFEGLTDAQPR